MTKEYNVGQRWKYYGEYDFGHIGEIFAIGSSKIESIACDVLNGLTKGDKYSSSLWFSNKDWKYLKGQDKE